MQEREPTPTTPGEPEQDTRDTQVLLGDQECPRCHATFTVSYHVDGVLVQARCLSCDLKWPLPYVV
jgi:hypothetical protein